MRQTLQARYSKDLFVLGLCGAAGDQSPHLLIRKRAEATLRKRKGISETEEIGVRIADAVTRVFDAAKANIRTTVPFAHEVEQLRLPAHRVSKAEADRAKARVEKFMSGSGKLSENIRTKLNRERDVVIKFERRREAFYPMELHVLRLGDIAITTNPGKKTGAYWQLSYTRQMKSRTEYVHKEWVAEIRKQIAAYKRFKRLMDQLIDLSIEHSQQTMRIARTRPKT